MDVTDVETIAVLGAGNMGHGIAEVAALAGFAVTMRDIEEDLVERGYEQIEWSLGKLAEHDQIAEEEADQALARVTPVVDLEAAVGDADVVIEAVPERMDVKREVWGEVSELAPEHAVFTTNTSSLSITELAETTDRPERFCGMHFFNPPVRMQLVEVIAGAHTSEGTLSLVEDLAEALGKSPVRVRKDSPGFIVNRVLVPMLNEAAWLVHAGDATLAEVDATATYDMGLPMGAFELSDQVGNDVALDVLEYLHETLGDAYEPCPLIAEKVEAGELGTKTDRGFYDYDDGGVEIPADAGRDDVATVLTAIMANEVAKLVGDDVADASEIDRAMQLGAGYPDGPARMADSAGLDGLLETLRDRHRETGAARYEPAPLLEAYADEGRGFYEDRDGEGTVAYETIRVEREGRVGRLVLDRPHRLNTVSIEMLDELEAAIDELEADGDVRAILLAAAGDRAFSAGADVGVLSSASTSLDAVETSRRGQRVFGKLEEVGLPVVAAVDGYCLGGGMELATCADLRVASRRAEFGQTESTLGIMPGWGATQRLAAIVGEGRARELLLTGDRYDAETMAEYGFVNEVVGSDEVESRALSLAAELADGPPIAHRQVKRALLASRDGGDAGFEVEAQGFGHLVTTDDFTEGIEAFMADREPEFEGR